VRSREKFAAHDFMVAVVDAPSDFRDGMPALFRVSNETRDRHGAVAEYPKAQASVPLSLVGTSAARGAIGAASDGKRRFPYGSCLLEGNLNFAAHAFWC
jgi:hypothetical protein